MSRKETPATKICKHCQTEIPYGAKICPQCRKKQKRGILKWILLAFLAIIVIGSIDNKDNSADNNASSTVSESFPSNSTQNTETTTLTESDAVLEQTEFRVGDIIQDGNMQIVYAASGRYTEDSDLFQPKDGYQYIFIKLACSNTGSSGDEYISYFSFYCYADGYAVSPYYGGVDDLSATLSPGRSTTGYVYFEVPEDAETIDIEYESNFWTEEKLYFIYEGDIDSGYVQEAHTSRSAEAFSEGDVIETRQFNISYLSCEDWDSGNMFLEPQSGYKYISLEFEFENTAESDGYVSAGDFYCYADGMSCNSVYYRDDTLGATLSSGRKVDGSVTFEVPLDAEIIEVEYETNYWTSSRIIFTAQ